MRSFIQFVEQKSEEEKNLQNTIAKLPKKYQKLLILHVISCEQNNIFSLADSLSKQLCAFVRKNI